MTGQGLKSTGHSLWSGKTCGDPRGRTVYLEPLESVLLLTVSLAQGPRALHDRVVIQPISVMDVLVVKPRGS